MSRFALNPITAMRAFLIFMLFGLLLVKITLYLVILNRTGRIQLVDDRSSLNHQSR